MENTAFDGIEPIRVWKHFADLVRVPRPSKSEFPAIEFLEAWADGHSFSHKKDAAGNLAVTVPALPGHESAPVVALQSHVDIVVSNAAGRPDGVDAALGHIPVVRADCDANDNCTESPSGDWIWAQHCTLGADNGLGVVCAMAAAEDSVHGPMILLFTVDEEEGLTGAKEMDPVLLEGADYLINLDSEDDDVFTVGCAGGRDTEINWSAERSSGAADDAVVKVEVKELKGGHSGVEIHQARGNGIRILSQLLQRLGADVSLRIANVTGGDRRNAIPRSAEATILLSNDGAQRLDAVANELRSELKDHFSGRDDNIEIEITSTEAVADAFGAEESMRLIDMLMSLPDGVAGVCPEVSDLVETSNNMALVSTDENNVSVVCSSRSSSAYALDDMVRRVQTIARLAGAKAKSTNGYPGWKPNFDSPLAAVCERVYESVFKAKPTVESIHAGLECGAILAKKPDLDAISVGPTIRGNHAPGERVSISSVQRFFPFLQATLKELASV